MASLPAVGAGYAAARWGRFANALTAGLCLGLATSLVYIAGFLAMWLWRLEASDRTPRLAVGAILYVAVVFCGCMVGAAAARLIGERRGRGRG